jgi:hypothetical protein
VWQQKRMTELEQATLKPEIKPSKMDKDIDTEANQAT